MKRIVLILAVALAGCWRVTIKDGTVPVGETPIEYDNKWHSGLIIGLA